ncbi:MAG: N-acetylglucosaminyldiphosphodolichol N-acetylglucosaminyltransferase catalytic subunit alg13 [Thelocarpon superellum]|nr:MAG: N-acetylglucosaminyldiphosphodolichol N-acetylglucosaminyltransferase catalytic subunit alg13 [Thelocarpon superellum]
MSDGRPRSQKWCFVTIGATARFDALLSAVLNDVFLKALSASSYTHLLVQYGKGESIFHDFTAAQGNLDSTHGISIQGFAFSPQGLATQMQAARGRGIGSSGGVVISHAGSGTILDALRIAVPLIVVPNESLLDNHQAELAEELASAGYAVHGKLDNLASAIRDIEVLRERQKSWPPVNSGQDHTGRGLVGVMDDEMGFVD